MSDVNVVSILQRQVEDLRDRAEMSRRRAQDLVEMAEEHAACAKGLAQQAIRQDEAAARIEKIVLEMGGQQ